MLFTLFVAALAATLWTLRVFMLGSSAPHDPSTLELASLGVITLVTFTWMKRVQAIRDRGAASSRSTQEEAPPVPARYAQARAEAEHEAAAEAERVA